MPKKYKLLPDDTIKWYGVTLYRIQALQDFGQIKSGNIGGYVEGEHNLSHTGRCWVGNNAKVWDRARVEDDAQVRDEAELSGLSVAGGHSQVEDHARLSHRARVRDHAQVGGDARVTDAAQVSGTAVVYDAAQVGEVVAGDDAVDVEVEAAAAEVLQRGEGGVVGLGADHEVVHAGAAAVQREVDVAQAPTHEGVDALGIGEQEAVGDEAEVHAEAGDEVGPAQQLGADRRLAARQHDHAGSAGGARGGVLRRFCGAKEFGGAADLGLDLGAAALDPAYVEGVAKGAVLIAAVADLD